jgi:5-methylcytosine-specific restriction endonuclease McrA
MRASCVLLNGNYTFLGLIDWKRAIQLEFSRKAKALRYSNREVRTVNGSYFVPEVLVLIKVVRTIFKGRVPFSKKNVIVRDGQACAYCGKTDTRMTIDHIRPRSRGGKTDWDNCVASCFPCNCRKGNRMPSEAGMRLRVQPNQPTISEFIRIRLRQSSMADVLVEWGVL